MSKIYVFNPRGFVTCTAYLKFDSVYILSLKSHKININENISLTSMD